MKCRSRAIDRGLTLVETTVVLAIVALLISLLLVAVQRVRESARKVSCQNNLHQLGIAVQNFSDSTRAFPSLVANRGTKGDAALDQSLFVSLLPELEQANHQIKTVTATDEKNKPPAVLRCPSSNDYLGYRFSFGSSVRMLKDLDGILRIYTGLRMEEVKDGLSNTSLASERMSGKEHRKPVGVAILPFYLSDNAFATDCTNLTAPESFLPDVGFDWRGYQPRDLTYTHYAPPNNSHWDCQSGFLHQLISARSMHAGGVFVLFADGHVTWASSNVDLTVWRALGTVAGAETNSEFPP